MRYHVPFSRSQLTLIMFLFAMIAFVGISVAETPPEPYRGAPIIPNARSVGEHRFRSPRSYEETRKYYKTIFQGSPTISFETIVVLQDVRAYHLKNKNRNDRWEGLNIYEYKGATFIFVVFSDAELKSIAAEKKKKEEAKGGASAPKKTGG